MLNNIRSLSKHPVILTMMGMLIFVFVLFFGLPGQGEMEQAQSVFTQWGARVNGQELDVSEALLYGRRRARRNTDELAVIKGRMDEMVSEALIDNAAREMGWVSGREEERKYMAGAGNPDSLYFGEDLRRDDDLVAAFKATLGTDERLEDMSAEEVTARYLAYARKSGGFKGERFKEVLDGWVITPDQYMEVKGRELRTRGYLSFLRPAVKVSDRAAQEGVTLAETSWRFSVAQLGAESVAPTGEVAEAAQVDAFLKDSEPKVSSYYQSHIEDYSKSQLKFTQVSARYTGEEQQASAKAKVEEARERVAKGEDPTEVAKSLSTPELAVSAFVMSNKTRKNTSEVLFTKTLALGAGELSAVDHQERPSFNFPGMAPQPKGGTYSFVRLEEKQEGEERSLKDAEREIAAVLIDEQRRAERAKGVAESLLKAAAGQGLAAAVDAHNAAQQAAGVTAVQVTESGDVKVDALLDGELAGVGRDAVAAERVLMSLFKLADGQLLGEVLKVGDKWVVLSLKEVSRPTDADIELKLPAEQLAAQAAREGQFFGPSWAQFMTFSPSLPPLPREVLMVVQRDLMAMFMGAQEGFLDRLLASKDYQALVERNPKMVAYFAGSGK